MYVGLGWVSRNYHKTLVTQTLSRTYTFRKFEMLFIAVIKLNEPKSANFRGDVIIEGCGLKCLREGMKTIFEI
jgi:hypothetical protein